MPDSKKRKASCSAQRCVHSSFVVMATSGSHGGPTPAQASSQGAPAPQVTTQGRRALARSKGIVRVPLEDLGPALFNRGGEPTSGRHCVNLARRILKIEGFATYRYSAG